MQRGRGLGEKEGSWLLICENGHEYAGTSLVET